MSMEIGMSQAGEETLGIVRDYVVRELLRGDARDVEPTTPLLEWGVLDSLNLMTLISFLQDRFEVTIPDELMTPENLGDLLSIAAMVERLQQAGRGVERP